MKILVVYESIPESTDLYILDLNKEELDRFSKIAGKYKNGSELTDEENEIADQFYNLLSEKEDCQVRPSKMVRTPVDGVIVTGFVL